jgi:hypothetical protein
MFTKSILPGDWVQYNLCYGSTYWMCVTSCDGEGEMEHIKGYPLYNDSSDYLSAVNACGCYRSQVIMRIGDRPIKDNLCA